MPLFVNVSPPWVGNEVNNNAGASHTLSVGTVYLVPMEVGGTTVVTGMKYAMSATATGNVTLGIYDMNGNLVVQSAATATVANNVNTISFASPAVLSAGRYLLALSPGLATDTYITQTGLQSGLSAVWTATNTATGTTSPVLPSSTGTLVNSAQRVLLCAVVQGGAP